MKDHKVMKVFKNKKHLITLIIHQKFNQCWPNLVQVCKSIKKIKWKEVRVVWSNMKDHGINHWWTNIRGRHIRDVVASILFFLFMYFKILYHVHQCNGKWKCKLNECANLKTKHIGTHTHTMLCAKYPKQFCYIYFCQ